MKVTTSVLVSDMRGSSGGVTMASWKGQLYARARVIPANPNTAAQQLQRTAFSQCVELWQEFSANVKSAWDSYVQGRVLSGFNGFMKANVAAEKAASAVIMTPVNALCEAPLNVVISTGSGSGEIDIDWDQGDATTGDQVCLWYRETESTDITYVEPGGIVAETETYTLTGVTAATDYAVSMGLVNATPEYSRSDGDEATSGA